MLYFEVKLINKFTSQKMKKKNILILLIITTSLMLSSCSFLFDFIFSSTDDTSFPPITYPTNPEEYQNYYKSETVDPHFDYQDIMSANYLNAIPNTHEDLNILVLPIQFNDYPFSYSIKSDLNKVFNGTTTETNYWESVSSFYNKSSFNKVNMIFTIADIYDTNLTPEDAVNLDEDYAKYFSTIILRNAVDNYKQSNSTKQFDQDGDGFIDAVWMVYSCPNYYSGDERIGQLGDDFWAYVFWDYYQTPSMSSPNANVHAWASYDFMYYGGDTTKLDAHTYIHETGHLFGLDDYYNYDEDSDDRPLGGLDMMDANILDHNIWSKMALGWVKPYVVSGDAIITINPSQLNGDTILLTNNWNGTSFDEFLLLELYTPTGLNELDSSTRYLGSYPRGFTTFGVRLYHVDSRLGLFNYKGDFTKYEHPSSNNLVKLDGSAYDVAHSNTPSSSLNNNSLIRMIQAGKNNTYANGAYGLNGDLFQSGYVFTTSSYTKFFKNNKLNNGKSLKYKIEFYDVSSTEATIIFTKL